MSRTEETQSGSAHNSFSGATHVFSRTQMNLKLIPEILVVRPVVGFEFPAATNAFSGKRNSP